MANAGVLLTFDGSEASRAAFGHAARLAKVMNADIRLLRVHAVPPNVWVHADPEHRERELQRLQAEWQAQLESTAADLSRSTGLRVAADARPLRDQWNVADAIVAVADEMDALLICMATKGAGALRHFVVGSTALTVLGRSRRPVVFVTEDQRPA